MTRPDAPAEALVAGVDIGGTFTDLALLSSSGQLVTAKAPTTSGDPSIGVFDAIERAARQLDTTLEGLLDRVARITHGSTVATNALLTRTGARVGLITTRGFEDTPFIMRAVGRVDGLPEDRVRHVAALTKPEPLVDRSRVRGVTERVDVRGTVVVPLRMDEVSQAVEDLVVDQGVESLAVCLLNAWANPLHEEQIRGLIEHQPWRGLYCVASHQLARVAGEYARMNTVLIDAFVGPRVLGYLERLETDLRRRGFRGQFLLMQGNGGLSGRTETAAVATLQSGPAGGMLAAAQMASVLGHSRVLTADMGGTSFDVGIYVDGDWRYAEEPIVERFRILQPIIEIESIGAGGGTIARTEASTNRLLVGPQSAGADPGPACYGHGGAEATVTDADVTLGIIEPSGFLNGAQPLDAAAARTAVENRVAQPLGLNAIEASGAIRDIVDGKMADLVRRQVIRSGHLPADFVLYAYGGAAPVHAAAIARQLGIETVYVFPSSPVFSAFGIALADVRHTRIMSCYHPLPTDPAHLNQPLSAMADELLAILDREGFDRDQVTIRRYATLRFRRQASGVELELPWNLMDAARVKELVQRFVRRYEDLYGVGAGALAAGVELNALRVDAIGPAPKPVLTAVDGGGGPAAPSRYRQLAHDGSRGSTPVYEWSRLRPGQSVPGPAVIDAPFTTVPVPAAAAARLDAYGNIRLELGPAGGSSPWQ